MTELLEMRRKDTAAMIRSDYKQSVRNVVAYRIDIPSKRVM